MSAATRKNQASSSTATSNARKKWMAEEIRALITQIERSLLMDRFSDTPGYWNNISRYFSCSSAENLRKLHLSIIGLQRILVSWKKNDAQH
ncbi:hypothetical protein MA16_Dca016259 [Dendrobium catenatum]|uniref:Uncharacterized protein n=1 Tax=Dendrobium catenatum TaxID=906689 RepID=A0A2I0W5L7_9ASPA|nr:hypothetical protein MA16_Dca016259 [Dendrobium catenatum]